jgi:transposase
LFLQFREVPFDSEGIIVFLEELLAQIAGKLLIIWDGAPIHRSKAIKQFLTDGAAARILLERLPGYAPDLNPDEGIWHYLKHVELKNQCCRDMSHLENELLAATVRLRSKPAIIRACFEEVGYFSN